jgi:DNA repair protein RecN (Recombination protein N)
MKLFLKSLTLQNFATFDNQTVQFEPNFNALVGETGSGKSLILDAFQFILGSRADKKIIRRGKEHALIEASFQCIDDFALNFFSEIGFPTDDNESIVIKRIIYASGNSKNFLNHQQCSLQVLKHFARTFIDLVGQFDNQKLLSSEYQLQLLDHFGNISEPLALYSNEYKNLQSDYHLLQSQKEEFNDLIQKEDFLKFQLSELKDLDFSVENEERLILQKNRHLSKEKKNSLLNQATNLLTESDNSLSSQSSTLYKIIEEYDELFKSDISQEISEIKLLLDELSFKIEKERTDDASQDLELEQIIDDLDKIKKVKRKYHSDNEQLISIQKNLEEQIIKIESLRESIQSLESKIKSSEDNLYVIATKLHGLRSTHAKILAKKITQFIQKLNMKGSTCDLKVRKLEALNSSGISQLDFLVETNPGEGFFPLKKVASGGELSRILLALRSIVTDSDSISIFFFDEIDTGIGGQTALKLGDIIKEVSQTSQVIAITHLPQIARNANSIISVEKETLTHKGKKRTSSIINIIQEEERSKYLNEMAGIESYSK